MGRGDKKSKKGKRFKGSYGVVRPRKNDKPIIMPAKTTTKKETTTKKKTVTKKK